MNARMLLKMLVLVISSAWVAVAVVSVPGKDSNARILLAVTNVSVPRKLIGTLFFYIPW